MSHECPHCGLPPKKKPRRTPTQSQYEDHLGTNIAFTVQDHVRVDIVKLVADAKADIAELDRNIEMLESTLAAAKKERDETIAFRDAHLALFPPVHQLPTEVLTEIFHLTFEKPYNVFASLRSGPWLLGKVCSRWRQVAWSCASLWTGFTLPAARGRAGFHKVGTKVLLEGALSRSVKHSKFHILLGGLKKTEINFLVKSAEGWHDASFEGSLKDFEPFLKIVKMPSLVALELDVKSSYRRLDDYYPFLWSLGKHVPQLRRLTLADADDFSAANMGSKFPWRQLTELVVPLHRVASCLELLVCCPNVQTLRDYPHLSHYNRVSSAPSTIPGAQAIVSHPTLSFIDMSSSIAIALLGRIRCPGLTYISLPCPRQGQSDEDLLQRFIQRSGCTITNAELTFDHYEKPLVSPEAFLSALSGIIHLKLSFTSARCPQGSLIECLSDRTVAPQLLTLTITATRISRSTWDGQLKDALVSVLSARYQSPEELSTRTNLQDVVIVLGRETYMTPGGRDYGSKYYLDGYSSRGEQDSRRLEDDSGRNCTIEDPVDADFLELRALKERGLDLRLSIWRGPSKSEYHIQMTFQSLNDSKQRFLILKW
ncbi:hypothetical protein CPB85DRAFT_1430407 [Mucidula mucida]|nr:hypothetical protein CPB85DRAFT_1430407 [Mucidula mucida]